MELMAPPPSPGSAPATPPRVVRILAIDDEPGIRELLDRELTLQGYKVETACDGLDALQKIEAGRFQLAVCDINMPGLGGLEVLAALRERDPDIEVIMVTGYATVEIAVEAMRKGAYDFIQKPFNLQELLALVEKGLEKRGLRETARLYSALEIKTKELVEAKRKLEETQMQLVQSEKLAGIGQLAAGVAHELNNPLSGILGFTQLLLEDSSMNEQQHKDLETIHVQSQRCRTIIQNLLQFSRRREPRREPLDIIPLLKATLELVKYEFSTSGIEIVQKLPASLPPIFGDSHQLQQVFLNLMTNARQAVDKTRQGRLEIETVSADDKLQIRVCDNGCGIAPAIEGKVFDPFFTTKPPGEGTGLGLSICYGILQQHDGSLRFVPTPGGGTTFIVELPFYA
jgi:two-component system, NtrC family, sensor kinase